MYICGNTHPGTNHCIKRSTSRNGDGHFLYTSMWFLYALVPVVITLSSNMDTVQTHHIQLEVVRISPGLKCMNNVVEAVKTKSMRSCILHGMSLLNCHAVNYNIMDNTCEMIVSHGVIMQTQRNASSTLATFCNNHEILKTGVETICAQSSVQWVEQFQRAYRHYDSVVYAEDIVRDKQVCKAFVGDNELPGFMSTSSKKCNFMHKGYVSSAEIYSVLVLDTATTLQIEWIGYNVGESLPPGAFIGGRKADGTLLYICRALRNGVYYIGHYDSSGASATVASVGHPAEVDLLIFTPNGPTYAGPTADLACPRFHVIQAQREVSWVEHRGPEPMPTGVVLSNSYTAVAEASGVISTVAKFIDNGNRFCLAYGITTGCQTWGHLMLTSLSYQWEPFQAGSEIPYNAIIGAYTHENQPLYHVMKKSEDYSVGSYNAYTEKMEISYYGIKRPSVVDILTLNLPQGSSAWTDDGYYLLSGPITAIRIQHGTTITGIECRFGAQWSVGFWSNISPENVSEVKLQGHEYLKGVQVGFGETMNFIQLHTNLNTFGPFGNKQATKKFTMFTSCGHIYHFSGYLVWDENTKINKTFSFAIHGQHCK